MCEGLTLQCQLIMSSGSAREAVASCCCTSLADLRQFQELAVAQYQVLVSARWFACPPVPSYSSAITAMLLRGAAVSLLIPQLVTLAVGQAISFAPSTTLSAPVETIVRPTHLGSAPRGTDACAQLCSLRTDHDLLAALCRP